MLAVLFSIKALTLIVTGVTAYITFKAVTAAVAYQESQINHILQVAGLE